MNELSTSMITYKHDQKVQENLACSYQVSCSHVNHTRCLAASVRVYNNPVLLSIATAVKDAKLHCIARQEAWVAIDGRV